MAERCDTENTPAGAEYQFCLFVSGTTPRSLRAIATLRSLCETFLTGRYEVQIIDVFDEPAAARAEQVVAVPTLIMKTPVPRRIFVGDLTNTTRLLASLGLALSAE